MWTMAITQLYKRFTRLDSLIKYVMNGDKTDEMKYVSGINCLPETAFEEMNNTKNRFNKGKEKIIDIAIKYNYESSQAYSRAFKKMMGFEPSNIKNNQGNIKFFAQYELTNEELTEEFNYQFNNKLFKVFFCFGG